MRTEIRVRGGYTLHLPRGIHHHGPWTGTVDKGDIAGQEHKLEKVAVNNAVLQAPATRDEPEGPDRPSGPMSGKATKKKTKRKVGQRGRSRIRKD